jgi:CheY-like chemotaxis protein
MGADVEIARDGESAVEAARRFRPDVVFMDIGMPKLNGYEAARRIRNESWGERMVLVALTGWGQQHDRQRASEAGFDHHLIKPAQPADLQRVLA